MKAQHRAYRSACHLGIAANHARSAIDYIDDDRVVRALAEIAERLDKGKALLEKTRDELCKPRKEAKT